LKFNKKEPKQFNAPPHPSGPFYELHKKYSRGQKVTFCKKCGDTSFELLEDKKPTKRCCRCGDAYDKD